MPVPDRPDPDDLIASVWGRWVQDFQTAPPRAALWRTTSAALAVDGANAITYEQKDDPTAMVIGTSQLKMPAAGLVFVSLTAAVSLTGGPGAFTLYASVMVNAVESRRGNQLVGSSAQMPGQYGSHVGALLVVAANDLITGQMFAGAAGVAKSLFGGRAFQSLELVYLTAF